MSEVAMSGSSGNYFSRCPPELVHAIFQYLCRSDLCACALTSRVHHDLTLPLVFSNVDIYIGDWGAYPWETTTGSFRHEDLVKRFMSDRVFASLVQKVTVHHYCSSDHATLGLVRDVLENLPNLVSLDWLGTLPTNNNILENLDRRCHRLKNLRVPSTTRAVRIGMAGLQSLNFCQSWGVDMTSLHLDHGAQLYYPKPENRPLIERNAETLRSLRVLYADIAQCSSAIFMNLTDIEFYRIPRAAGNLWDLFKDSTTVESLALEALDDVDILVHFKQYPTSFPRLASLKIISYLYHVEEDFSALTPFIENHVCLRKLDVKLEGMSHAVSLIMPAISRLPRLEVLGFGAGYDIDFNDLSTSLPDRLRMLRIAVGWSSETPRQDAILPLYHRIARMSDLEYIYIQRAGHTADMAALVEQHWPHLSGLGQDENIWTVKRTPGSEPTLIQWSKAQLSRRSEADFQSKDASWLMRHHRPMSQR